MYFIDICLSSEDISMKVSRTLGIFSQVNAQITFVSNCMRLYM